ncbi:MAG: NUDIX hydrolase [Chloroflexota bacterium]
MSERKRFQQTLPRKRMAAGCLLFDENGRFLIVQPRYRDDGWLIPGGIVEANESPRTTCLREMREEIGFTWPLKRLLCVDYCAENDERTEALNFIFLAEPLSAAAIGQIQLQSEELAAYCFVVPEEATDWLVPPLARRVQACLPYVGGETAVYLENQEEA